MCLNNGSLLIGRNDEGYGGSIPLALNWHDGDQNPQWHGAEWKPLLYAYILNGGENSLSGGSI